MKTSPPVCLSVFLSFFLFPLPSVFSPLVQEFCDHAEAGDGDSDEVLPTGACRGSLAQRIHGISSGAASTNLTAFFGSCHLLHVFEAGKKLQQIGFTWEIWLPRTIAPLAVSPQWGKSWRQKQILFIVCYRRRRWWWCDSSSLNIGLWNVSHYFYRAFYAFTNPFLVR